MPPKVKVQFKPNRLRISRRIETGDKLATIAVTEAVIEYGNIYVREDQGTLKDSALIASRPKDGLAIWDTEYARRVYYTGTPSKDKNPNASLMWVEQARNTYKDEIIGIAQNAFDRGMRK